MSCFPILNFEIPILSVVLCGGMSTRMGTDKGLIKDHSGNTWAQNILDKCGNLNLETKLSINPDQIPSYSEIFNQSQLIVDVFSQIGPLAGLLSVHNAFPNHDLFVLSCDMQDVDASLLHHFLNHVSYLSEFDVVITQKENFHQPFPGLYSAEFLKKLGTLHISQQIEKYSFQHLFNDFYCYHLAIPDEHIGKFKSYNHIVDLE